MNDGMSVYLRKAVPEDMELLFQWVNDTDTRNNSFDSHLISRDEHEKWFEKMMNDPERIQYIMMDDKKPVGQIRLDIDGDTAEISYSIAPNERNKGYGRQIIELIKKQVKEDITSVVKLTASVKSNNKASMVCFEHNGFSNTHMVFECLI